MTGKRPLTRRGAEKLGERERAVGLDADDAAAQWLAEHEAQPETHESKSRFKSKELHRWRQRQQRDA